MNISENVVAETTAVTARAGRIDWMDGVKALAIFLVLLGHALQYLGAAGTDSPVWAFIYAFHMPLFMMVGGFFSVSSLRLPLHKLCLKKGLQLLLPCVVWGLLSGRFAPVPMFSLFWFLSCLFCCHVLAWTGCRLFPRSHVAACAFSLAVSFLLVGVFYVNSMFPFFWAGIFASLQRDRWKRAGVGTCGVLWAVFAGLLWFWKSDYTIYFTPLHTFVSHGALRFDPHECSVMLYRLLTGLVGASAVALTVRALYRLADARWVARLGWLGGMTMGIYVLQRFALEELLMMFSPEFSCRTTLWLAPFVAVAELFLCGAAVRLIGRNRWLKGFLLGGFSAEELRSKRVA